MNIAEINLFKKYLEGNYGRTEVKETHISWVLLCKNEVWKIKKPVKNSFLDFSTPQKRYFFCQEEVRLNQRFAPDIYLGVRKILQAGSAIISGNEPGSIVDYAVLTRRLPSEKQMSELLEKNEVDFFHIKELAWHLKNIHNNLPVVQSAFDASEWNKNVEDIMDVADLIFQVHPTAVSRLPEILAFSETFIERFSSQIQQRINKGFKKECHGDLHSGNIFLTMPPVIFDCIEFDEKYRNIDVLYDISFLLMDLDYFGRSDLGDFFLKNYGFNSQEEQRLILYFKLCRTLIRAKVSALLLKQQSNETAREKVKKHLLLAEQYMLQLMP